MSIDISAGATLSLVQALPATYDQLGYEALTFVVVGEVGSIGEFGGESQIVEWTPLATGIVDKRPGSTNYGDSSITYARDASDAGQILLQSGFDGANNRLPHSFRISHPTIGDLYFTGVITSAKYNVADANSIYQGASTTALTSKPLHVAAA